MLYIKLVQEINWSLHLFQEKQVLTQKQDVYEHHCHPHTAHIFAATNTVQPSLVFHTETSHLLCKTKDWLLHKTHQLAEMG